MNTYSPVLADDAIITQKTYVKEEEIMVEEELKEPQVKLEEAPKAEELSITGNTLHQLLFFFCPSSKSLLVK